MEPLYTSTALDREPSAPRDDFTVTSMFWTKSIELAVELSREFGLKFCAGGCLPNLRLLGPEYFVFDDLDTELTPVQLLIFKAIVKEHEKEGAQ